MKNNNFNLSPEWQKEINDVFITNEYKTLYDFITKEYEYKNIYPKKEDVFNALNILSPKDVKVVIIGQDPYHQPGQAHGLSFSVKEDTKLPPSLRNIFKELGLEYNKIPRTNGDLTDWALQGVLLLNTIFTVEESKPGSHAKKGWEAVSQKVIRVLSNNYENIVFMLWGNFAHKYEKLIDNKKHKVIKTTHPSPLGANKGGWFNSNCFLECDSYLISKHKTPIIWF